MATADVHERLQALTRQAVLHFRTRLLTPDANLCARASSAAFMSLLAQSMTSAATLALGNYFHAFCGLPRRVLRRLCWYLSLGETIRLSATSRGMRAALLGIPDLWTDLYTASDLRPRGPAMLDTQILSSYLERSGQQALSMNIFTTYDLLVTADHAPVLARSMRRVSRLWLEFFCDAAASTASGWQCLNQTVLGEPAPLLTDLDITAFSSLADDPTDPDWRALSHLALGNALFAGDAPRFRTCRLSDVRLPPRQHCAVFRNITALTYNICGEILSSDLELIDEVMPRLEMLDLAGIVLWDDSKIGCAGRGESDGSTFKSLRVLSLSAGSPSVPSRDVLFSMFSFQQLAELWLLESGLGGSFLDSTDLYPTMDSLSLVVQRHQMLRRLASHNGDTPTHVVVGTVPHTSLSSWIWRYPLLTHVEIQELYLNNDTLGPPPPMPRVRTLVVFLARCEDWFSHAWEFSGIVPDPEQPWVLPALRSVHFTAAHRDGVAASASQHCGHPAVHCMCGPPLRVALREIAYWVRNGVQFDAEMLDTISFSGIQVVDRDFCAAWEELMGLANRADVSELPGEALCPSLQPLDYYERWRSRF